MRFYLNEVEIAPENIFDITLNSDFTGRPGEQELSVQRIILPREGYDIVREHMNTIGVQEGIPARVEFKTGNPLNPQISMDYYVDLYDPQAKPIFRGYTVEVAIKKRKGKDNFFDQANGTSFELMAKKGIVFNTFDLPYVIIKDDSAQVALTLGVSLYVMTRELITQIKDLVETVTDLIKASTPNVGVPPSIDLGDVISLAVKATVQTIVIGLLIVSILKMGQQFFELIFPKIRYFKAAKVKELMEKGCEYLGYEFKSDLLDQIPGLTYLPVPLIKEKGSWWDFLQNDLNFAYTKGYPTASDNTELLGELFDEMELIFNGKTKVVNGVVEFEIRNHWQKQSNNQMIPAINIQDDRDDEYTLNTEEAWKRSLVNFQTDFSDLHTLDFFDPTNAEYSTEPVTVVNSDLVTIKGLNKINSGFALGVRKKDLNWLEKIAKGFFELIDEVTGVFGSGTNFVGLINKRKGVLQVSQQFYSKSKLMYTVNGKQPSNYASFISANSIYQKYHKINEITQNAHRIYEEKPVRINASEFVSLLDNNYAEIDGVVCEILKINYSEDSRKPSKIWYKMPDDYANGKMQIIAIDT